MVEKLDIVNEEDEVIGVRPREEVHDEDLRHRSVMFFVFNFEGKVLMTQRSEDKRFYPGYWSIVLGGHVTSGLSYEEALEKEIKEELGVRGDYEKIGEFKKDIKEEKENVKLYKTEVDPHQVELSPEEFKRGKFIPIDKIEEERKKKDFVPETEEVLDLLKEDIE